MCDKGVELYHGTDHLKMERQVRIWLGVILLFLQKIDPTRSTVQYVGSSLRVRRTSPIQYIGGSLDYTVVIEDEFGYEIQGDDSCQSTSFIYQCSTSDGTSCTPALGSTTSSACIFTGEPFNFGFGFTATEHNVRDDFETVVRTLSDSSSILFDTTSQTTFYTSDPGVLTESVLNQPPQANMLPLVRVRFGCATTIEIPIFDSDPFDSVRCQLGGTIEECGGGTCALDFGAITLQESPCQLIIPSIDSPSSGILRLPVALVIIDTNVHGRDMSRVSLQFTVDFISASGPCNTPGYSPQSIFPSNGITFGLSLESTWNNRIVFDDDVSNGQATFTPSGGQVAQSSPTGNSFRLRITYDEDTNPFPETVCYQYIDQDNNRPSQVFCAHFKQRRAAFSRLAVAGNAGAAINVLLNVTQGLIMQLDLVSNSLTPNGVVLAVSPSVFSGDAREETFTIVLGSGSSDRIEVGMISITQITGPELLVYTHPAGSTDFFITVKSIALLESNENMRVRVCRNGDLSTAAVLYIVDTDDVLETSNLDRISASEFYFIIPSTSACHAFVVPLIATNVPAQGTISFQFDAEGPYRIDSSQSSASIALPSRCAVSPCQNNGVCTDFGDFCDCIGTGYTGDVCNNEDFVGQLDVIFEEVVVSEGDLFRCKVCLTTTSDLPNLVEATLRTDFIGFSADNLDVSGSSPISFNPTTDGPCSDTVSFLAHADFRDEGAEDFAVTLDNVSPPTLSIGPAQELIIVDNDAPVVRFQQRRYSVLEGESITLEACVTEVMDASVSFGISFQFQPPASTDDLVSPGGTLPSHVTIPGSQQCGSFSIQAARDSDTLNETFAVSIEPQPPWVTLGVAVVVIYEDNNVCTVTSCPQDITVPTLPGNVGNTAQWSGPICSQCQSAVASCDRVSGSLFPVGSTQVTCTCVGSSDPCIFTVSVTVQPVCTVTLCPQDITVPTLPGNVGNTAQWSGPICSQCQSAVASCNRGSGSLFPVGSTQVTCTCAGSSASCVFTVTIQPECTVTACPQDLTVSSLPSNAGNTAQWSGPICSQCQSAVASCDRISGSLFPVGSTQVTCTCVGASAPCVFTVSVTVQPECTTTACPRDITVSTLPGNVGNTAQWSGPICNQCQSAVASCDRVSGSFFPIGPTQVICTCAGASVPCLFIVTVQPVCTIASCPLDITVPFRQTGNTVTWNDVNCENCLTNVAVCSKSPGSLFPEGSTRVTCSCSGSTGSSVSCAFTVMIECTPVAAVCPSDDTVPSLPGNVGNIAPWTDPECVPCEGVVASCDRRSTDLFSVGSTLVNCSCPAPTAAPCTFTVTVTPDCPSVAVCPADITVLSLDGNIGNIVTWSGPGCGVCDGVVASCDKSPGSFFTVGSTQVTCSCSGSAGDAVAVSCVFTVTVERIDECTPVCPPDITVSTLPDIAGNVVQWDDPVCRQCASDVASCSMQPSDFFELGTTQVKCCCTDSTGTVCCSFAVTVNMIGPPNATCPSELTVTPWQDGGYLVIWSNALICTDKEDPPGSITPTCNGRPGVFQEPTTITCTCTDSDGNVDSCSFNVLNTPPEITCPPDVTVTSSRGNSGADVHWGEPNCSDNEEGGITPKCSKSLGSFPAEVGVTMITCTCTDSSGGNDSCGLVVTVLPYVGTRELDCPPNITVMSTGDDDGTRVTWEEPSCPGGSTPAVCDRESGSFVKGVGSMNVTCTCSEEETCIFTVTIEEGLSIPVWLFALAGVTVVGILLVITALCCACRRKKTREPTDDDIDLTDLATDDKDPTETTDTKFNTYKSVQYNKRVYDDDGQPQTSEPNRGSHYKKHVYNDEDGAMALSKENTYQYIDPDELSSSEDTEELNSDKA